jgi:hypothetical protein
MEKEISFEEQLILEESEKRKDELGNPLLKKDKDGTVYEWDEKRKAWFPKVC